MPRSIHRFAAGLLLTCLLGAAHAQTAPWRAEFDRALAERDQPRALAVARAAADAGDNDARTVMGLWTRDGVGTPRDPVRAREWLAPAAAAGVPAAQNALADMLVSGSGGPRDLPRAAELARAALDRRHGAAGLTLARLYRLTDNPDRDDRKALDAAIRAAELDHAPAYGYVGVMMATGVGTEKNTAMGARWLRRGAETGDLTARANLGWLLAAGDGVARAPQDAERLLTEAAGARNAVAMSYLARLYQSGTSLPRDYNRSYFWANLALANNAPSRDVILRLRDEVEAKLPADQVSAVQQEVRGWQPVAAAAPNLPVLAPAPDPVRSTDAARPGSPPRTGDGARPGDAPRTADPQRAGDSEVARPAAPRLSGQGTAFFVSADGHALTNMHVVRNCLRLESREHGVLRVLATDATNDLALLKAPAAVPQWARFKPDPARLGEPAFVFGFPLTQILASSGNFTTGTVSALAGIQNNPAQLQLTAQIQPGNSGGAVLDAQGRVIGVVVAQLKPSALAGNSSGALPQNVNFAVHGAVAKTLLAANGVAADEAGPSAPRAPEDIAETARRVSVQVHCYR